MSVTITDQQAETVIEEFTTLIEENTPEGHPPLASTPEDFTDPLTDDIFNVLWDIAEQMDVDVSTYFDYDTEISLGDTFKTPAGPIEVVNVSPFGDDIRVTDPTDTHPQSSRAGNWDVDVKQLRRDILSGEVTRAKLEVVEE